MWHVSQGRAAGEQQATGWATNSASKEGELGVGRRGARQALFVLTYTAVGILVDRGRISINARCVFDGICIVCVSVIWILCVSSRTMVGWYGGFFMTIRPFPLEHTVL